MIGRDDDTIVDIPNSWWRDHLHVAVWILVACVLVLFLRLGAEAVVPFVLSVLLFYALDPAVDALQRWRVPRAIGAALMLGVVLTGVAAGVALLITSLEGWAITPALMGRAAQMNRVAVFAGLLFWSWMWGIWGTLLAVPMMMVVKVICDHVEDFQPVADFLSE